MREQLLVPFTVDEDDRNAAANILFRHSLEQVRLPRPRHPERVRLHRPRIVAPVKWLAEDVVTKHDRVTPHRFAEILLLLLLADKRDRPRPGLLHFGRLRRLVAQSFPRKNRRQERVDCDFYELASSDVKPVVSNEVQNSDYPEDEYPTQQDGILSIVLTTYYALSWHLRSPEMEAEDCYADPGERRQNNTHNQQGMNFA